MQNYNFYGSTTADVEPIDKKAKAKIKNPRDMYDLLLKCWCKDTCAPRLQDEWSEANPTLGQCSITAFLVQDIFGGIVYGIERPGGNFHCYNDVDGCIFDLTSEQFGDEAKDLVYEGNPRQHRADHFEKTEEYNRYLFLKKQFEALL